MESAVRFVLTHRRVLAAALAGLAAWAAIGAVTRSPDTREVLVAARDLGGGSTVTRADVRIQRLPRHTVPEGSIGRSDAIGRALAGAMRAGEVFTDRRVVDPRDLGEDRVLATVEVPSATGDLLRSGDAVDLLAVGDEGRAVPVAEAVEVITVRSDPDRETAVLGVAASPRVATEVARASVTSRLTAVVVGRQRLR
ncbi:SAF domain-containing protein [Aeromicrobium choanae]|uniref:Chaperone for flagella basal body P-ring formation n=1 Tax=Aeromicrobium choanae TaxID=1736691 RepID=A0A1T4Z270_9ACTN|nr:SAF domain-containing protein [Aeromicrobium choanae]SKB08134.1 Chaperone for flagella basal body P-ring formation [Aeromicrobium choanae]